VRAWLLPFIAFVALLALWQALVRGLHVPAFIMPAPTDIGRAILELAPVIPLNIFATLSVVLIGFALSVCVSLPLGILLALSSTASQAIYPLLVFMNAVPIIAIAPIIVVMLGTGIEARLLITFLVVFFPVTVAVTAGVIDTPREYLDLSRAVENGFLKELWTIRLPHATPFIFSGLKIGISLSTIGTVVAEFITSQRGLGYLIITNTTNFDLPRAIAAVTILATVSVILYQIVQYAQRRLCPWSEKRRPAG
jgi:NitT/TauT family transport system permease protein